MTAPQDFPAIAVIREGKVPPDARTPLTPEQAADLRAGGFDVVVQPSPGRIFADAEYTALGVPLVEDLSDRQLLLGIKEVPVEQLIPGKTYCFFAHVAKEQPYNRDLMRALLERNIHHVDYEYLTDETGARLIAFGYWAGMVGAHNALWAYGERTGAFRLPRLHELRDYAEAREHYAALRLPDDLRVVLTGTGRVGQGAARVLEDLGLERLSPADYLRGGGAAGAVFTQLGVEDYAAAPGGNPVVREEFYARPEDYASAFAPYAAASDVFINGIFWDGRAPAFFTADDMRGPDFRIRTIGDITCDIAPAASVPSTLFASTIADPVFGYDPASGRATAPYGPAVVDVMSIDNLPSELPRDASAAFGEVFIERILPEFGRPGSAVLERATITRGGELGPHFGYLAEYAGIHP